MTLMRAKFEVAGVQSNEPKTQEILSMRAVAAPTYDETGADEDNTFAKFSPSANLTLTIANPTLFGSFAVGDRFYVDFTRVPVKN